MYEVGENEGQGERCMWQKGGTYRQTNGLRNHDQGCRVFELLYATKIK